MKFYYSPLSIAAILLFAWGIQLIVAMLRGAWATYFAFIFPALGIILFIADFYIKKSNLKFRSKLIIQILIVLFLLVVGYLIFKL